MDPDSTCEHVATGTDDMEVMSNMMAHAKEAHADKVAGMTDEQMNEMMMPHIKEESVEQEETTEEMAGPAM